MGPCLSVEEVRYRTAKEILASQLKQKAEAHQQLRAAGASTGSSSSIRIQPSPSSPSQLHPHRNSSRNTSGSSERTHDVAAVVAIVSDTTGDEFGDRCSFEIADEPSPPASTITSLSRGGALPRTKLITTCAPSTDDDSAHESSRCSEEVEGITGSAAPTDFCSVMDRGGAGRHAKSSSDSDDEPLPIHRKAPSAFNPFAVPADSAIGKISPRASSQRFHRSPFHLIEAKTQIDSPILRWASTHADDIDEAPFPVSLGGDHSTRGERRRSQSSEIPSSASTSCNNTNPMKVSFHDVAFVLLERPQDSMEHLQLDGTMTTTTTSHSPKAQSTICPIVTLQYSSAKDDIDAPKASEGDLPSCDGASALLPQEGRGNVNVVSIAPLVIEPCGDVGETAPDETGAEAFLIPLTPPSAKHRHQMAVPKNYRSNSRGENVNTTSSTTRREEPNHLQRVHFSLASNLEMRLLPLTALASGGRTTIGIQNHLSAESSVPSWVI